MDRIQNLCEEFPSSFVQGVELRSRRVSSFGGAGGSCLLTRVWIYTSNVH